MRDNKESYDDFDFENDLDVQNDMTYPDDEYLMEDTEYPVLPNDDEDDYIDEKTYAAREKEYENYIAGSDNEVLKAMTQRVEDYMKDHCVNHKYFTDEELQDIAVKLKSEITEEVTEAVEMVSMGIFKYVRHLASKHFSSYYREASDLVQEGMMAVLADVKKYDPSKGTMTTFFKYRIINRMQTYINSNTLNLNRANHYGNNLRKIDKKINDKLRKGEQVVLEDLSISGGIEKTTLERCLEIRRNKEQNVSIDDDDAHINGIVAGQSYDPEQVAISKEKNKELADIINSLDDQSKEALFFRFGILDGKERSISEIAKIMDTSPQTARNLIYKAVIKMEGALKKSRSFNVDRIERKKRYNVKAFDFHVKSSELQKILDDIDLENMELDQSFIS